MTWRRGSSHNNIIQASCYNRILLLGHQLGHLISTYPDQESTGAVGNPEGFLLQVFNRLWQLIQQGKQSPERNLLDVTYWLHWATLGLSSLCIRAFQPAALTEGLGSTAAAAQNWQCCLQGLMEAEGWQTKAAKNHCHLKGPRLLLLFQFWGALLESPHSWLATSRLKNISSGASLVVQWLRIRLPMQETWVRALVQEDPTCRGATKPVRHNYWACALEPVSHNYWTCMPRAHAPQQAEPLQWEAHAQQRGVAPARCN